MSTGPIMIMAGGTGGHIFPGLAVAEALKARNADVVWLGSVHGLEARLVPEAGLPLERISVTGLRGRGWTTWLAAPFRLTLALVQAWRALRRRRPAAVLGMGGFVAGPGGLAAWLTGRPLLIHEQNAVAGSTNRVLARVARRVFAAFPDSFPARVPAELVGNPVRASILALAPPRQRFAQREAGPARLLILGGSQGAQVLNQTLPLAVARLPARLRPEVWHQAGVTAATTQQAYRQLGVDVRVEAFIGDMAAAYGWADLVVARAGALTLAELAAAGLGAVLVPYPHAVDDHQTANARHFVRAGAALLLPQDTLTAAALADCLQALLADRARLLELAECARGLARAEAAGVLAEACLATLEAAP